MIEVERVSLAKIIILSGVILTIVYAISLNMENIALTALGIIGGYLTKDIESSQNDNGVNEEETEIIEE